MVECWCFDDSSNQWKSTRRRIFVYGTGAARLHSWLGGHQWARWVVKIPCGLTLSYDPTCEMSCLSLTDDKPYPWCESLLETTFEKPPKSLMAAEYDELSENVNIVPTRQICCGLRKKVRSAWQISRRRPIFGSHIIRGSLRHSFL